MDQGKYYIYIFFNNGKDIMMSAKKLTNVESIAIAASLVLVIALPMNPSEYIYQLAYAEASGDPYSNGYDRGYEDGQDQAINEQIRDGESG
jgi:hypothetical protein